MAGSGTNDFCGNWLGGWLQTAKEKGTAALDMVRKDLTEFGCTMQKDTSHAVEVTSTTLKETLKADDSSGGTKEKLTKGLNSFLEGISKAIAVPPDDEGQIPITASSVNLYQDRAKARLHALQVDPDTYLHQPDVPADKYGRWCKSFELDAAKGEISELLVSKAEVRSLYTQLVPSRVSHVDFWRHYFYRKHQVEVDQARKEDLMKRAEQSRTDDTAFHWEVDWSGDEAEEESTVRTPSGAAGITSQDTPPAQQTPSSEGGIAEATLESSHPPIAGSSAQGAFQDTALKTPAAPQSSPSPKEKIMPGTFVDLHPSSDRSGAGAGGEGDNPTSSMSVGEIPAADSRAARPSPSQRREESSEQVSVALSPPGLEAMPVSELQSGEDVRSAPVSGLASPASGSQPLGSDSWEQGLPAACDEPVSSQSESGNSHCQQAVDEVGPEGEKAEAAGSHTEAAERENTEAVSTLPAPATVPAAVSGDSALSEHSQPAGLSDGQPQQSLQDSQQSLQDSQQSLQDSQQSLQDSQDSHHGAAVVRDPSSSADHVENTEPITDSGNLASAAAAASAKSDSVGEDDWGEDELDVEVTEEEMKAAQRLAHSLTDNINLENDDWENWE